MQIDSRWDNLNPTDWAAFAEAWLIELRGSTSDEESDVGEAVVRMNFTATPEQQWAFILAAVSLAESDEELGHIAAGPIEHLLGWHGKDYIDLVEQHSERNPKFARALTGVAQYLMPDEVWSRIRALQRRVTNPIQDSRDKNENA